MIVLAGFRRFSRCAEVPLRLPVQGFLRPTDCLPERTSHAKSTRHRAAVSTGQPETWDESAHGASAALLEDALFQVKRVIVGQDRMVERALICLLARGHCLIEGVPGLAKTLTVSTLAQVIGGSFARLQFTPDLVPADIVGTRIWRPSREEFDIEWGPVFANIVLADEINRAPAKVQSALLEAMAEFHVSIGGHTRQVPNPFLVLATQNPIESEGVYALPEAQRDRFMMQIVVRQPSYAEETEIARRMGVRPPHADQVLTAAQLVGLQNVVDDVFVHHAVQDYAVRLVMATRDPERWGVPALASCIALGASPRATLGLLSAGRALAVLRGRRFLVPQDIHDVAPEVLRHRLMLSYDALADGIKIDDVVNTILGAIQAPRVAPHQDESAPVHPTGRIVGPQLGATA
jgi:MoxR-like ATPase